MSRPGYYANGGSLPASEAAMTWDEIGEALGYPRDDKRHGAKMAIMIYRCALAKLRRRPGALEHFCEIAAELKRMREQRSGDPERAA
jgi:hypothetical protein